MSNRCGPVESVFKNDRSIHWTRCPLCLFFFGSQRWPFSTLIGERIWTSRDQLWVNMVNASFLKFRVCTKWRQGDVCTKFRQVRTLFFGDMLSPASIPQRPYTECQPQRGQWQWWRWCLCMWDPQPKTPKLGIDGSWVPHFGAIAAAICDAANCSGENLSALLDNNLRRQPGFGYFDFLRSAWPL